MKRIVLFFTVIAALAVPLAGAAEKPLVLSTIKPIHALVSAISGEAVDSQQIIPDFASAHHYSLKPSDLRKVNKAQLIFRIDPMMETQLNKSLKTVDDAMVVVLSQTEGLELLNAGINHTGHDHHDDHEEAKDYHLWLDPANAILMTEHIRDTLITLLPEATKQLNENADSLIKAIQTEDKQIRSTLKPVTETPFLVMHDAWQYFTHYYSLGQLGSISQQEGLKPSGKALSEAREKIRNSGVRCIVNEPGVKIRTLAVLTEDLNIKTTEIDPLGRSIPLSDQTYPELLRYTAKQLLNCLAG